MISQAPKRMYRSGLPCVQQEHTGGINDSAAEVAAG